MDYNSDFSYDLKLGKYGEGLLSDILKLKGDKIEVKTDFQAMETGNLFIEYESRKKLSGISISKAEYWAFLVSSQQILIIETDKLKKLCRNNKLIKVNGGDNDTSKGVLLPLINFFKGDCDTFKDTVLKSI